MAEPPQSHLTERHFAEIGRVIVSWSMFEHILKMMAYSLTADSPVDEAGDRTAAVVFQGMEGRVLVGILVSLIQMRFSDKAVADFRKFAARVLAAKKHRDLLSHALFEPGQKPDGVRPILVKTVGGLKQAAGEMTPDDIRAWVEEIRSLQVSGLAYLVAWGYMSMPASETPE